MAISICPSRKLRDNDVDGAVPEADLLEADVLEADVLEADILEADVLEADILDTDFCGRRMRKGYLINPVLEAKVPGISL